MSQQKVKVEIHVADIIWRLITSVDKINQFIDEWKDISLTENVICISGSLSRPDANGVEYIFKKENIVSVMIQEIKL